MTKKKAGAVMGRPKGSGRGVTPMTGLRMPTALRTQIDAAAEAEGRTRSAMMLRLLEEALAARSRR